MILSFRGTVYIFAMLILASTAQLAYLSFYPHNYSQQLTRRQYQQDLNYFIDSIKKHSAFAVLNPDQLHQLQTATEQLANLHQPNHSAALLTQQLQQAISLLNDPAANVELTQQTQKTPQYLPILPRFDGEYWHAYANPSLSVTEDLPYLTHIDGVPMIRWVKASQAYLADPLKQSPQAQAAWLAHIVKLRQDIGLAAKNDVTVTVSNGEQSTQVTLPLITAPASTSPINSTQSATSKRALVRLNEQVDEVTITQLSQLLLLQAEQQSQMQTLPLILDIRAIKQPQPLLMHWLQSNFGRQQLLTIGVLRYKPYSTSRADHIAKNYIPLSKLNFFEQSRLANKGFENTHKPSLALSDFLVRQYQQNQAAKTQITPTTQKLILLVDSSCEQECEWLALASQQWPNVELIGEKTRGSLAPRWQITLPNSGIAVQVSQGVIYSPNGQQVSGIGLTPAMKINQLAIEQNHVGELIASHKLTRPQPPLKDSVAVTRAQKR